MVKNAGYTIKQLEYIESIETLSKGGTIKYILIRKGWSSILVNSAYPADLQKA
jgi:hypothetical protein